VKSGAINFSFSSYLSHGSFGMIEEALSTSCWKILDLYLSTIATQPSQTALEFSGST
jgi:hypothetical protein